MSRFFEVSYCNGKFWMGWGVPLVIVGIIALGRWMLVGACH